MKIPLLLIKGRLILHQNHGILQARVLEWVAIPFSRGSSQPRDWTWVSCIAGRFFTSWATREALPTPGDLANPGIKPASLLSPPPAGRFFTTSATSDLRPLEVSDQYGWVNINVGSETWEGGVKGGPKSSTGCTLLILFIHALSRNISSTSIKSSFTQQKCIKYLTVSWNLQSNSGGDRRKSKISACRM